MGVTVTTAATNFNLTTFGLVALELGLAAGDTTLKQRIDPLIDEVSSEIAWHCGRVFARQTYTETLEGGGDPSLFVTHRPLVSLTSVSYSGTAMDTSNYGIASAEGGRIQTLSDGYPSGSWYYTAGYPRYTVVYVAGYLLPGEAGENLPAALRRIATEVVCDRHNAAGRDLSVVSRRMGDLSVTYAKSDTLIGFSPSIIARLRPFLARRFA